MGLSIQLTNGPLSSPLSGWGRARSGCASQVTFEGNQLLKSVVLVQVVQVIRLLLGLAGVLRMVHLISFCCLSLVFVLLCWDNLFRFNGLILLSVFFWALLSRLQLRRRRLPRHLHGSAGQWTRWRRFLR